MTVRNTLLIAALVAAAAAGGYFSARVGSQTDAGADPESGNDVREPLYWQAPMDPSYRRDEPGQSPMGMDLIPVYAEDASAGGGEPSIRIDPAVVNNIGVRTALAERADISRNIETVGYVAANEEREAVVTLRTEGWVEDLAVDSLGEHVSRGDLLFLVYAPALVSAQSEYLQARRLGRPALLNAAEERLLGLGMSRAEIDWLAGSGEPHRLVSVYAPQDGVVTQMNVREGGRLAAGETAMRLADLSDVWVIADIFESEVGWVEAGQAASMTLSAFPAEGWAGEVDYVYPVAEADSRTVRVRLRFPNPEGRLRPNMYAEVAIDAAAERHVVVIPTQALIRDPDGDRVILALGEGRFRPARVTAGVEADDQVEIVSGLAAGERVVTSSQFLIDSEASLDAALLRLTAPSEESPAEERGAMDMSGIAMDGMTGAADMPDGEAGPIPGTGVVEAIDAASGEVTLSHEPIPEIDWPAMRMGFAVARDAGLETVQTGDAVTFAMQNVDGQYVIVAIAPADRSAGAPE